MRLNDLDLSLKLSKQQGRKEPLAAAQERMLKLRLRLGGQTAAEIGPPLCVVFEGWDASGKGGAIRRLVAQLDPRHVRVVQYAAPTPDELRHQYLLRFADAMPGWGGMCVLDRSWYGRLLVERVEGFATPEEWQRAYGEINDYERAMTAAGMILVKCFLHISDEEQLKRFQAREKNPLKSWKLTDEDWRNRGRRAEYTDAIEEMFERTSTDYAPWTLIEADSKRYARVKVIESVCDAIERTVA